MMSIASPTKTIGRLHELDELMQRKVKRLEGELLEANDRILKLEIEHE